MSNVCVERSTLNSVEQFEICWVPHLHLPILYIRLFEVKKEHLQCISESYYFVIQKVIYDFEIELNKWPNMKIILSLLMSSRLVLSGWMCYDFYGSIVF